jgi:hypothetical protein
MSVKAEKRTVALDMKNRLLSNSNFWHFMLFAANY